jgi:hypothetical protein
VPMMMMMMIRMGGHGLHSSGCCEHGNEPLGSTKCREFPDQLRNYRLLKKDSAPWG